MQENKVEPGKQESPDPADSYTFELPYDNDLDQDELNRRLRKPGEPGYCPPGKTPEAANPSPLVADRKSLKD